VASVRTYLDDNFRAYPSDVSIFAFRPWLVHRDLDGHANVLVSEDGGLAGVIDFSDMVVGNPAIDLWMPLRELADLGIDDQTQAALDAYGLQPDDLAAVQRELDFLRFFWAFSGLLSGLAADDER
jgi:Ser/Thr protein kinase RdoA (MazF antagonist)